MTSSDRNAPAPTRDVSTPTKHFADRARAVPVITYPEGLPVSAAREEIAAALREHQVIVVAGETGSGKTTQLPKICLELGRGVRGMIGHTQPRRLAARAVAERIAEETGTEIGAAIGFSVRFTDRVGPRTLVKVMTDGILLRELRRDRMLRAYDTLIIDEAHERSLNIDYILGYLKQLLPQRPDLKLIITSATIDPHRFARHFSTPACQVPVLHISGRTYPVEIRYRPIEVDDPEGEHIDLDQTAAIDKAIEELWSQARGDILVFLPTERDIRETAHALRHRCTRGAQIVPLYARLSAADQHKVFAPSDGRRIVLATNIAETSLTVPGIRYVIDTGTARISRYSTRTKVQRLPIEPVSQASARQRAGRCGRVAEGVCVRIYSEDDFEERPEFTDPEILRTNLAAVILSMTALGLGEIEHFPFLQTPDARAIRDGIALLTELGAWDTEGEPESGGHLDASRSAPHTSDGRRLSKVGRDLSQIPVDPRIGRMLIEANHTGCLREVLVIAAALSLPDVRERPADNRDAADTAHRRFDVPGSEFLSYLTLWDYLDRGRIGLSNNAFRRQCEREFLHWLRIREWRDLHRQLTEVVVELGWTPTLPPAAEINEPIEPLPLAETVDSSGVHRAILSGLLSQIGQREGDTREFLGARGTHFAVFPGSALAKKPPRVVMAAEIVETSRLWARTVAGIEPEWAEKLGAHLVKRNYSEPHWSANRGSAVAYEKVTLYGVPLVTRRPVNLGRIDPAVSRELFIRHALVDGQWRTRHEFFHRNRELLEQASGFEDRARRRDILVDADTLYAFYDARIPKTVVSTRHFDSWWKRESKSRPQCLTMTAADVATSDAPSTTDFPDAWRQGDLTFALRYRFEPGAPDDGVSVLIPADLKPRVRPVGFDWLVPGMRHDLAVALIRTLPKQIRRQLVPASDFADAALTRVTARSEPLVTALARVFSDLLALPISAGDFDIAALPVHLRMHYVLIDSSGTEIARADTLNALGVATSSSPAQTTRTATFTEWTDDGVGSLLDTVSETVAGQEVTTYPGLAPVVNSRAVVRHGYTSPAARDIGTRNSVIRLVQNAIRSPSKNLVSALPTPQRLALSQSPYPDIDSLLTDCGRCAVAASMPSDAGGIRTPAQFRALTDTLRPICAERAVVAFDAAVQALTRIAPIRDRLRDVTNPAVVQDVCEQLENLVFNGFVGHTELTHLAQLPRYLDAIIERIDQLPGSAVRDTEAMASLDRVIAAWTEHVERIPKGRQTAINERISWMVEELRVSLFAQRLKTAYPVSEKRVLRTISELR